MKKQARISQDEFPSGGPADGEDPASRPEGWQRFLRTCRAHRGKTILAGLTLSVALGLGCLDALLAGPMQRWAERTMNSKLKTQKPTIKH